MGEQGAPTDDTPPRGGGITLIQVGDLAKNAANEAFQTRMEVVEMRRDMKLVLSPVRRAWYERVAQVAAAVALVVIAYAVVMAPKAEARPIVVVAPPK